MSGPEVMTIHICTYIIGLFSLQGQKLPRKSFRVPFLRQGSFFKINKRNISEATELCEGSKLGFLRMANIARQGLYESRTIVEKSSPVAKIG